MPIVGTGTGITSHIEGPATPPETTDEAKFWNEVDKFKAKANEAYDLWQELRAKRQAAASNPKLSAEYEKVMDDAETMTAKVSDVEKAVAAVRSGVAGTITGWFGLEGYRNGSRALGEHLHGLGFAPVIIAVVAAAVAWIGSWVAEAYVVNRKLDAVENLTEQGVPYSEAGQIIADQGPPGALEIFAGRAGLGVALAGLAAVTLYFFFEKKKGF